MPTAPRFPQVEAQGPRWVLRAIAILVLGGFLALIIQFDPPAHDQLPVNLVAVAPVSCGDWESVLAPRSRRHSLNVSLQPCVQVRTPGDVRPLMRPGEVTAVLGLSVHEPGRSGEGRSADDRYFLIEINPGTLNFLTWRHELGGHVIHGHTAVRAPEWLLPVANTALDLLVLLYLVFGDQWLPIVSVLAVVALAFAYRHQRKGARWGRESGTDGPSD